MNEITGGPYVWFISYSNIKIIPLVCNRLVIQKNKDKF